MSQGETGSNSGGLSMLQAALLDGMEQAGVTKGDYANQLRVSRNSLTSWLNGANPLRNAETREKLGRALDLDEDELRVLGATSVEEACDIVLTAEPDEAERSAAQDVMERFVNMAILNGMEIPKTDYIIFLTGDLTSRQMLVDKLEDQGFGDLPSTPSTD